MDKEADQASTTVCPRARIGASLLAQTAIPYNLQEVNEMIYVGLDVHKSYCVATALDNSGKEIGVHRFPSDKRAIEAYIKYLPKGEKQAVIEASTMMYPLYSMLEGVGVKTKVANPSKVKAIASAKIKTDKIDSRTLAHLLRAKLIPECYIPSNAVRELRKLCRHRASLNKQRTHTKNSIHALLAGQDIKHSFSDLFGSRGRAFLDSLRLSKETQIILNTQLAVLDVLNKQMEEISKHIAETALVDKNAKLLMTIPGIGYYTALTLTSEIGDIKRFESDKQLCSWAGLVPSTYQSGQHTYHGRITKQGNKMVRWVLVQATQQTVRYENPLTKHFEKVKARKDRNKAIVATARKMLMIMYAMLSKQEAYRYADEGLIKRKEQHTRLTAQIYLKRPFKKRVY